MKFLTRQKKIGKLPKIYRYGTWTICVTTPPDRAACPGYFLFGKAWTQDA